MNSFSKSILLLWTLGGGLQASQMLHGKLADFQMWDRAMSNDEVRALGCYEKGNLVAFQDFDTVGFGQFKTGGKFYCTPWKGTPY